MLIPRLASKLRDKRLRSLELAKIRRNLEKHVFALSAEIGERNLATYHSLNQAATYITNVMSESTFKVRPHDYYFKRQLLQNIVAEKQGTELPGEIIIIGAHYDTVINSPGADDNSSGVAGLLELTRMLDDYESRRTIRIVAFTLEEPPFHDSPFMGSSVYARYCHDRKENVIGMVSLEMIGFYTTKSNTQHYPRPDMEYRYPDRGDFIAIVGNQESRELVNKTSECIKLTSSIHVLPFVSVHAMPGISLSDHAPFWKQGVKAIMVTDTAFFRNPHYHNSDDTYDTLNYDYSAKFLYGFANAVKKIDSTGLSDDTTSEDH